MSVAPELLSILACPRCKGPLRQTADGSLGCARCRVAYPVVDDIPAMFFEEAAPWTPGSEAGQAQA
jgi:uncharacterized protein YbaR (Trm112 family)